MKLRHLAAFALVVPALAFAQTPAGTAATKAAPKAATKNAAPAAAKTCTPKEGKDVKVRFTTSMGNFTVELDKAKAPVSVDNFVKYVESGHYNGTIFHRVISNFMIQGGGFTEDMQQKPTNAPIKNEGANGLKNDKYTLAMARTGVRDSATAQFFINVKDNDFLNYSGEHPQGWGYAVFGKVVEGTDTIDKIKGVATGSKMGHGDVPNTPVVISKAECI